MSADQDYDDEPPQERPLGIAGMEPVRFFWLLFAVVVAAIVVGLFIAVALFANGLRQAAA